MRFHIVPNTDLKLTNVPVHRQNFTHIAEAKELQQLCYCWGMYSSIENKNNTYKSYIFDQSPRLRRSVLLVIGYSPFIQTLDLLRGP